MFYFRDAPVEDPGEGGENPRLVHLGDHIPPHVTGDSLAKTEAGSDGIDEHVAISNKNDAHINEEDCENERPDLVDATQRKNGPR